MIEALTDNECDTMLTSYQNDPIGFLTEILDVDPKHVWPKMEEVAESVRDNDSTAVFAGHGVSKTYTVARLALWFLYCFPTATVVTTAPGSAQIKEQLWREIREAWTNSKFPLGGRLLTTKLDLQELTGEKWFAIGFATKPDTVTQEATRFQGYHNDNVLVIFDEAAGILPQIWRAAQYLTGEHTRFIAIGNPTSDMGNFADCDQDPQFHCINISVKDTPNFKTGKRIIPGVNGREHEKKIREKYGEDSNEYKVRILGQKPDYREGTFYGRWLAKAKKDGRIGRVPWDPSAKVYTFWDIGDMHNSIWFAQFIKEEIRLIDHYYDHTGQGLPAYAKMMQNKPYVYAKHYAPHDIAGSNAKNFQTGKYALNTAAELDIHFEVVAKHLFLDEVEAARDIMNKCIFDEVRTKDGRAGLANFRKKKDELHSTDDKFVYHQEPIHDWASHIARSFGNLAIAYRFYIKEHGQLIGYPHPISTQRKFKKGKSAYGRRHVFHRR